MSIVEERTLVSSFIVVVSTLYVTLSSVPSYFSADALNVMFCVSQYEFWEGESMVILKISTENWYVEEFSENSPSVDSIYHS